MGAWLLLIVVFNLNGQYEVQHMDFRSKSECQEMGKALEAIKIPKGMEKRVKYHHMLNACVPGQSEEEFSNNLQAILNDLPKRDSHD